MYVCMYVYSFKTVDKSQHRQYRQTFSFNMAVILFARDLV